MGFFRGFCGRPTSHSRCRGRSPAAMALFHFPFQRAQHLQRDIPRQLLEPNLSHAVQNGPGMHPGQYGHRPRPTQSHSSHRHARWWNLTTPRWPRATRQPCCLGFNRPGLSMDPVVSSEVDRPELGDHDHPISISHRGPPTNTWKPGLHRRHKRRSSNQDGRGFHLMPHCPG